MALPENVAAEKANTVRRELDVILNRVLGREIEVTCERCEWNDKCSYAWDLYNTDGDCLAEK